MKYLHIVRGIFTKSMELNLGLIAAGVAFFSMLSLVPGLAALIALFGLFFDPSAMLDLAATLKNIVPSEAYTIIYDQMTALIEARTPTLGLTGLLSLAFAVWTARAGVGALMQGLNTICEVEDRGSIRYYTSSIGLTLLLICVAGVALAAVVILPILLAFFPIEGQSERVIGLARWGLAMSVIVIGLGAIYRFGPNLRGRRVGWFSSGALMVAVLWFASSYLFSFYLSRFADYNETYGSIGAVAALMMWFYISAYLVLFGAAWNMAIREDVPPKSDQQADSSV